MFDALGRGESSHSPAQNCLTRN